MKFSGRTPKPNDEDSTMLISAAKDRFHFIETECGEVEYFPSKNAHSTNSLFTARWYTYPLWRRQRRRTEKMSIKIAFLANSIWQIGNLKRFHYSLHGLMWTWSKKKWVVAVNLTDHMIWTVCAHTSNLLRAAVRWVWFIQHKSGLATFCLPNTFAAIVYKCEGECNAIRYALMQFLWKCRVEITHFGCIRHRNNMHIAHTHVTELKH